MNKEMLTVGRSKPSRTRKVSSKEIIFEAMEAALASRQLENGPTEKILKFEVRTSIDRETGELRFIPVLGSGRVNRSAVKPKIVRMNSSFEESRVTQSMGWSARIVSYY